MINHDSSRTEPQSQPPQDWRSLSDRLTTALKPIAPPLAISFLSKGSAAPVARRSEGCPQPNENGRTGQVPAGCVFWIKGTTESFATVASDHANCSVGSFTHGFLTLEEAAAKDDVCAVLESGWVDVASVQALPRIAQKPDTVVYGPLASTLLAPDVVLLRINGFALMTLKDAIPSLRIEGKPQCHIVAIAKEHGEVAASRRLRLEPRPHRHATRGDDLCNSRRPPCRSCRGGRGRRHPRPDDGQLRRRRRQTLYVGALRLRIGPRLLRHGPETGRRAGLLFRHRPVRLVRGRGRQRIAVLTASSGGHRFGSCHCRGLRTTGNSRRRAVGRLSGHRRPCDSDQDGDGNDAARKTSHDRLSFKVNCRWCAAARADDLH
jgi:uncharacterized protein (DUF169 family)